MLALQQLIYGTVRPGVGKASNLAVQHAGQLPTIVFRSTSLSRHT